jgi:hypothetical protein
MKVFFGNVRGLGGRKRKGQLKELISKHKVVVFYLWETMEREFALSELRNLVGGMSFFGTGLLPRGIQEELLLG